MSWARFTNRLKALLGSNYLNHKKSIYLVDSEHKKHQLISKEEYDNLLNEDVSNFKDGILVKEKTVEINIREIGSDRYLSSRFIEKKYNDLVHNCGQALFDTISVNKATIQYLILYFENYTDLSSCIPISAHFIFRLTHFFSESNFELLEEILKRTVGVDLCLVVSRTKGGHKFITSKIVEKCNDILLYLSMNDNVALQLGSNNRKAKDKIVPLNDAVSLPFMGCKDSFIVKKYIRATAADNLDTKYLFWYQILERVSQKIAPSILISDVKKILSSRSSTEFDRFTKAQSSLKDDGELTILYKMLLSCIQKDDIFNYLLPSTITYYETKTPDFINGDCAKISFESQEKFARTTANRIYRIRNAIVHSKEENFKKRLKETPFDWTTDGKLLKEEMPLIKAVTDYCIKAYSAKK